MLEVINRLEQRWAAKPAMKFEVGQVVATPAAVCESRKARIVGVEWGPQHGRAKTDCSGWLYWLVEVGCGGSPWAAGESELLKWAKG